MSRSHPPGNAASDISFRPATRADVPAVVAMLADDALGAAREGAGDMAPYLAAFDGMEAEPGNRLYVGELAGDGGGQVVACYQLVLISGLSLKGARRAEIEGVRVASHLRGRKIGAALMADAEARAKAGGAVLMQLTTNRARTGAHRFYERLGFTGSHFGYKKPL